MTLWTMLAAHLRTLCTVANSTVPVPYGADAADVLRLELAALDQLHDAPG
jgi:hypothetical protein